MMLLTGRVTVPLASKSDSLKIQLDTLIIQAKKYIPELSSAYQIILLRGQVTRGLEKSLLNLTILFVILLRAVLVGVIDEYVTEVGLGKEEKI